MTGQELIDHMRTAILDDAELPYAWLNAELLQYLNFAEVQVCHRSFLDIDFESFTLLTEPGIEEEYHEGLMDWATHLAYLKIGEKTFNPELARLYEAKFIQQFGPLPTAYGDRIRKTVILKQRMRSRIFGS